MSDDQLITNRIRTCPELVALEQTIHFRLYDCLILVRLTVFGYIIASHAIQYIR